jgi:sRNA-binding regulator protein Hfq
MDNPPRGSSVSDKQMGRAAAEGTQVVMFLASGTDISGYVVGMDDYHWLLASVSEGLRIVHLVHKTCPLVSFLPHGLDQEDEEDQQWVTSIGSPFWGFCRRTYLGENPVPPRPRKESQ